MLETRGSFMGRGRTIYEVVDMFWLGRGCGSSCQCILSPDSSSSMMVGSLVRLLFTDPSGWKNLSEVADIFHGGRRNLSGVVDMFWPFSCQGFLSPDNSLVVGSMDKLAFTDGVDIFLGEKRDLLEGVLYTLGRP